MILCDTSVLVDLRHLELPPDSLALSVIALSELRLGMEVASDAALTRERRVHLAWLDSLGLEWLPFDKAATEAYAVVAARVLGQRRSHARSRDILLAGHAYALGASIATLNPRDFELVEDMVPVVVPPRR